MLAVVAITFLAFTKIQAQAAGPVALLNDAYATLAHADHDYKGHRVRALKQVEAALGEMGEKISGSARVREPQGTSDAQMRAAEALLQQASPGLTKKPLKHVNLAIEQINIALSIK